MRIATWNINSLRVRLDQVLAFLDAHRPDLLALQETKLPDEQCPEVEIRAAGYHPLCSGQKGYNGVAIFARSAPDGPLMTELPGFPDPQRRVLGATFEVGGTRLRLINLYVPNGQSIGSDKFLYKLAWLEQLAHCLEAELKAHPYLAVVGDLNIAPEPRDVYDPQAWEGHVLFSEQERAAFRRLLATGLVDAFRRFEQPPGSYTWWDYRAGGFRRNRGLRIDHVLVSPALAARCTAVTVERGPRGHERPSDHAPVIAEFA